jgi:hypothetical protein
MGFDGISGVVRYFFHDQPEYEPFFDDDRFRMGHFAAFSLFLVGEKP